MAPHSSPCCRDELSHAGLLLWSAELGDALCWVGVIGCTVPFWSHLENSVCLKWVQPRVKQLLPSSELCMSHAVAL